jgi:hypothetical protein
MERGSSSLRSLDKFLLATFVGQVPAEAHWRQLTGNMNLKSEIII